MTSVSAGNGFKEFEFQVSDVMEKDLSQLQKEIEEAFPIPTTSGNTSDAVQEAWNEQMAIISEIVTNLNTVPPTVEGDDLYRLLDSLNALVDLAKNGITDELGETYYLTDRMADSLKVLLAAFAINGIRPNMPQPVEDPLAVLLKAAADPPGSDPYEDPLQVAVMVAISLTYENLELQSYLLATILDKVLPIYGSKFEDLYDYLEINDQVLNELDDILIITNYVKVVEPWMSDISLENPGDISPEAASAINDYIMQETLPPDDSWRWPWEDDPKDDEYARGFYDQYQKELKIAETNAAANGTTVQEEMAKLQGGYGSSSDRLKAFIKDDEERAAEVQKIMSDSDVKEVETVPTLPDSDPPMTWTDAAEDLYDSYKELSKLIEELDALDADPKLTESRKPYAMT